MEKISEETVERYSSSVNETYSLEYAVVKKSSTGLQRIDAVISKTNGAKVGMSFYEKGRFTLNLYTETPTADRDLIYAELSNAYQTLAE